MSALYPDMSDPKEQERLARLLARLEQGPMTLFDAERLGLGFVPPLLRVLEQRGHIILAHRLQLCDHRRMGHEVVTYYLSTKCYGIDEDEGAA